VLAGGFDQGAEELVDPNPVREVGVVLAVLCISLRPPELRARNAEERCHD